MAISSDEAINQKIVEMRKENNSGLLTIMKWLQKWDSFMYLDEQILLAHILNVFKDNGIEVTNKQIKYAFDKNYSRDFHGDKKSYLIGLYSIFNLSEAFEKRALSVPTRGESASLSNDNDNRGIITQEIENGGVLS